jgi:ABC-2 type transport system permease protein
MDAQTALSVATLFRREMTRFFKFSGYAIGAPIITTLLYLAVFVLAVDDLRMAAGVDFAAFLVPGLVMMTVIQNAFENTAMYMVEDKIEGTVADLLTPPITPAEVCFVLIASAALRGLLVGGAVFAVCAVLAPTPLDNTLLALAYAVGGAWTFAALGLMAGVWADKWDHLEAVRVFIVVPLTFLSATFFSLDRVPEDWRAALLANPVFYLMDGFRAGVLGFAEASLATGAVMIAAVGAAATWAALAMLQTGYKLKP